MVGLNLEQHFLPLFGNLLEESKKFQDSKNDLQSFTKTEVRKTGKWFGGLFNKLKNECSTTLEIEELLQNSKVISMKWRNDKVFSIHLADGKGIYVAVKDLYKNEYVFHVDRYYHFNEAVSDVAYNDEIRMMYLMSDGRLHVVWNNVVNPQSDLIEYEFTQHTLNLLPNNASKRAEKRITLGHKSNMFAIWWSTSKDDVLPWLPNPEQRANIFIYNFEGNEHNLLWYIKTHNNVLEVYLKPEAKIIVVLEESADSEGKFFVTQSLHNIELRNKESEFVVPFHSELTAHAYDPNFLRLALTCCDSTLIICCQESKVPRTTKAAFIPSTVSWHPDSHLIFVAGNTGQYQFFDIALNPLVILESNVNTLSITHELAQTSPIQNSCWMPDNHHSGDSSLLIRFQSGPLTIIRLAIARMKLRDLIKFYLREDCVSEAINVLRNIPWTPEKSLQGMYAIFTHLIRQNFTDDVEGLFEQLLSTYFVPTNPNSNLDANARKSDLRSMRTLARRFFMSLVAVNKFHRAMQIATSLNDMGLFYKLHQVALRNGDSSTAFAAKQKLKEDNYRDSSSSETDYEGSESCTSPSSDTDSHRSSDIAKNVQPQPPQKSSRNRPTSKIYSNSSEESRNTSALESPSLSQVVVTTPQSSSSHSFITINSAMGDSSKFSIINFGKV